MANDKFFYLGRLFSEYLEASIQFKEFSKLYEEEKLSYTNLEEKTRQPRAFFDNGGLFFRLKELAHKTRKTYESEDSDDFETSLCWIVETVCSDIFHGLTMVRESFYKSYKNFDHGNKLRVSGIKENKGFGHEEIMDSLELILEIDGRSKKQAVNQFSDLNKIVNLPIKMFEYLIIANRENHFIKMSVYNNLEKMKTLYGPDDAETFLNTIYGIDEISFKTDCRDSLIEKGYYDVAVRLNDELPESEKIEIKLPEDYLR